MRTSSLQVMSLLLMAVDIKHPVFQCRWKKCTLEGGTRFFTLFGKMRLRVGVRIFTHQRVWRDWRMTGFPVLRVLSDLAWDLRLISPETEIDLARDSPETLNEEIRIYIWEWAGSSAFLPGKEIEMFPSLAFFSPFQSDSRGPKIEIFLMKKKRNFDSYLRNA